MANTPTPRSFSQILGQMIAHFRLKSGIGRLKVGGPILSLMEGAAQSDLRATKETFTLLSSTYLEEAEGTALVRIARDENTEPISATPSSGKITITDTRYTKRESKLYQGAPAPASGASVLYIVDGMNFPASGQIYIGRGTANYEGPLSYTSISNNGSYWTVNLNVSTRTKRAHNLSETVILAQGGNRTIQAGTIVQTPQANAATSVRFSTLYPAVIPDGETYVEGVQVTCTLPGTVGNIAAGAITEFASEPFAGAMATNPMRYSNGFDTESTLELRDRIRNLRQARTRGTDLALKTYATGVLSADENKRVVSASVVNREDYPITVYIDDGTGYEETQGYIAIESLVDYANGGEEYFQLAHGRPVAKAFAESNNEAPFILKDNIQLTVEVGNTPYVHTFLAEDFRAIASATAYEIVASINANAELGFQARTSEGGTKVVLFSKGNTNEDIQVQAGGANDYMSFPLGKIQSVRLYRNDVLLSKDGQEARLDSRSQGDWGALTSGDTLILAVDGTAAVTYTFTDLSFVNAGTNYTTLSRNNSLEAWAAVLNASIPGITATANENGLTVVSNAGRTNRAKLQITGGTLVQKQMFYVDSAQGYANDYTLNRNTGQIHLSKPLALGERLTAGTVATRAFIESDPIPTSVSVASTGKMWIVVDGSPAIVTPNFSGSTSFTISTSALGSDQYVTIAATAGTFVNVQTGDWVILWDSALSVHGAWRVAAVAVDTSSISFVAPSWSLSTTLVLPKAGMTFVRTDAVIQELSIPAGYYTAQALATKFNGLVGANGTVARTNRVRLVTNTYSETGSVYIAAAEASLNVIPMKVGKIVYGALPHVASLKSAGTQNGTPDFVVANITNISGSTLTLDRSPLGDQLFVGLKSFDYDVSHGGYSQYEGVVSEMTVNATAATLDNLNTASATHLGRCYLASPFALGPGDDFSVMLDNSTALRFDIPMYRKVTPKGSFAQANLTLADTDGSTLALVFGESYDFDNYALFMHPVSLVSPVLYRLGGFGRTNALVRYGYPTKANATASVTVDPFSAREPHYSVTLPSGAARTLSNIHTTGRIATLPRGNSGNTPYTYYLATGLKISNAVRTGGTVTLTLDAPGGLVAGVNHQLSVGAQVYVAVTGLASFVGYAGTQTLTAVGATTITYSDGGPDQGSIAGDYGVVYFDSVTSFDFTGVNVNDVICIDSMAGVSSDIAGQGVRVASTTYPYFIRVVAEKGLAASTSLAQPSNPVGVASRVTAYTVGGLASVIVAGVNSNSTALSAVLVAADTTISQATWDANSDITVWYQFSDGVNWISATTAGTKAGVDYTFNLEKSITVINRDWTHETCYLVPMTCKNVIDFMGVLGITGFTSNGRVERAGQSLQLSTLTSGSNGGIEVLGGLANGAIADVRSAAVLASDTNGIYCQVPTAEAAGFHVGNYVRLVNTLPHQKASTLLTTNVSGFNSATRTITFTGTIRTSAAINSLTWRFERQGKYLAIAWNGQGSSPIAALAPYYPGDYVIVTGANVHLNNLGVYQIIAIDRTNGIVYIENDVGVEQGVQANLEVSKWNDPMPGDRLVLGSLAWANFGTYTVASVTNTTVTVIEPLVTEGAETASVYTQLVSGKPAALVKKIAGITPNPNDGNLSVISFSDPYGQQMVTETLGTQMIALDKFDFDIGLVKGANGYAHTIGLVGEVNRVLYGDERDPVTYPGVVASGSNVNIAGPVIRRIEIELAVRLRTGTTKAAVFNAIRSAVASVVNASKVGESIPFSKIIGAVNAVGGVVGVTIVSPPFNSESDSISVQPHEKAMILALEQDVQVSLLGA